MGGPSDIAYKNAMDDFARVDHVPIVMTNLDVGHGVEPIAVRLAESTHRWRLPGSTGI